MLADDFQTFFIRITDENVELLAKAWAKFIKDIDCLFKNILIKKNLALTSYLNYTRTENVAIFRSPLNFWTMFNRENLNLKLLMAKGA